MVCYVETPSHWKNLSIGNFKITCTVRITPYSFLYSEGDPHCQEHKNKDDNIICHDFAEGGNERA